MSKYFEYKQRLLTLLNTPDLPITQRGRVTGAAAALVTSRLLPPPTVEVDNPRLHLITEHQSVITSSISKINEIQVFDARHAYELAISLWLLRYYAVYPKCIAKTDLTYGMVDSLVNAAEVLSPQDHALINEYKTVIALVAPTLRDIIEA